MKKKLKTLTRIFKNELLMTSMYDDKNRNKEYKIVKSIKWNAFFSVVGIYVLEYNICKLI